MKIKTKLTLSISAIVIIVFGISIFVSQLVLPKYYVYELNQNVKQALNDYKKGEKLLHVQEKYHVIVAQAPLNQSPTNVTAALKQQLESHRVSLNKFWISEEVLKTVSSHKEIGRIYHQGEQKSSFIARFKKKDQNIVMVGASMADFADTARVINQFNFLLLMMSVGAIIVLAAVMARKWTRPILEMKRVAEDIGNLRFKQTNIQTNDEIEMLAGSINKMSRQLESAQALLTKRNLDLKEFMTGLTHELKTPLALIKAYASGIHDGLDDGTYLNTIVQQVEKMEKTISQMLYYAKMETSIMKKGDVNLGALTRSILDDYNAIIQKQQLDFQINAPVNEKIEGAPVEKVRFILDNLISNAIKYASSPKISILIKKNEFFICNETDLTDISLLWRPFYVAESSRNDYFSGTGLGLSIVNSIAQQEGYAVKADLTNKIITFTIQF